MSTRRDRPSVPRVRLARAFVVGALVALPAGGVGQARAQTSDRSAAVAAHGWSGWFSSTTDDPRRYSRAVIKLVFDGTINPASWADPLSPFIFNQPYTWTATYEEHDDCYDIVGSDSGTSGTKSATLGVRSHDGTTPPKFSFQGEGAVIHAPLTVKPGPDCDGKPGTMAVHVGDYLDVSAATGGLTDNATSLHGRISVPTRYNSGATTTYEWSLTRPAGAKTKVKPKPHAK